MNEGAGATPEIVFVVARGDNGVIGQDGALPWHIPEDLKHFKQLTMGKPMLMGRRTFDSLPGVLPGRRHLVLTRDNTWHAEGAEPVHDVDAALALCADAPELMVIGGAEIFALLMDRARRIELTEVHRSPTGDVKMPPLGPGWRVADREMGGPDIDFVTLVRD
ncbi:dihydrofolate reductase [Sphingomonas jatrophae]|uniref:Dihydrofolate reductase n=1 Tax=Sphingomonas jatrophae TaxID=1166337 RepID=A0A1I6JPT8_9SPHN|nr:dihydrofolate reductase [Sphingomonas jatrophae]SFR81009.1 dihydrofolate reductase [Sphingomonas jatrophae]